MLVLQVASTRNIQQIIMQINVILPHLRVHETYCSQLVNRKGLLGGGGVAGAPGSGLGGRRSGTEGLAGREGRRERATI